MTRARALAKRIERIAQDVAAFGAAALASEIAEPKRVREALRVLVDLRRELGARLKGKPAKRLGKPPSAQERDLAIYIFDEALKTSGVKKAEAREGIIATAASLSRGRV